MYIKGILELIQLWVKLGAKTLPKKLNFFFKILCRIRVAAAAAASSVARAPSSRRLTANKGAVSENHVLGNLCL